jgi:predicted carbohydrate-binding protein with CBM5 and CBM33 domain
MQKNRKSIQVEIGIIIKKITGILLLIIVCNASLCQANIQAQKGVLDLRTWNWTKNGISDLNGEWEFYWKSLYTPSSFDSAKIEPSAYSKVPGFWNSLIPA